MSIMTLSKTPILTKLENNRYTVKVNGKTANLEEVRVSAMPFNRVWPGKQRDINQSEIAYMVRIFDDKPIFVEIIPKGGFERVDIRPYSKGVEYSRENGGISFELTNHGQYTVEFDGEHFAIHLFFDAERDFQEYGKPTHFFGPGVHNAGLIKLKSGDSIYIDKDAVVYGSIYGLNVSDIKIYGFGVLNAGWEERKHKHGDIGWDNENFFDPKGVHTYGGIRMFNCENIIIDGIVVCDPATYAISFFKSSNIKIYNTKVVGLWKYNNDGIDFFNCCDIHVKGCFVRSFDDTICLKGMTAFSDKSVEKVIIEDSVFWCGWGRTFEIGIASACPEIKNVLYRNCDLIHNSHFCLSINDGQWAHVHDITYENLNIEYSPYCMIPTIQKTDDQVYEKNGEIKVPFFATITDYRRNWLGNKAEDEDEDIRCKISDVLFKNINIYIDEKIKEYPEIFVKKAMNCSDFSNIVFEDIFVNGVKTTDINAFGDEVDSVVVLK